MTDSELIQFVDASDFVEIHLNDGRVLRGRKGTSLKFFLQKIDHPDESVIVGAIVNGELKELSFAIDFNSKVKPVTLYEEDGARIYRRSLTFLLEAIFFNLYPGATLTIDHAVASGGYYCQISGRKPLTDKELTIFEREMKELVYRDLPINKKEIPLSEAIRFFEQSSKPEKVQLLQYRQKNYLTIYCLEEYQDYHHGFMVPSTGYLKWFKLVPTNGGFTLRFPRRETPTILCEMKEYPKLLSTFRQYGEWLDKLEISNVGALNDAIKNKRSQEIVLVSEAFHELHVSEIAYNIQKHLEETQVVIIAGPSSSGKTTFSKKLSVALLARGISPVPIEMDNYFVNREMTPKDEKGEYNFEDIHALNLKRLETDLSLLMKGEDVQLPAYNFITGTSEPSETIRLHKDEILLIEGIHGLNPELLPNLKSKKIYRIYVSALTQLNLDRNNRISTTSQRREELYLSLSREC